MNPPNSHPPAAEAKCENIFMYNLKPLPPHLQITQKAIFLYKWQTGGFCRVNLHVIRDFKAAVGHKLLSH